MNDTYEFIFQYNFQTPQTYHILNQFLNQFINNNQPKPQKPTQPKPSTSTNPLFKLTLFKQLVQLFKYINYASNDIKALKQKLSVKNQILQKINELEKQKSEINARKREINNKIKELEKQLNQLETERKRKLEEIRNEKKKLEQVENSIKVITDTIKEKTGIDNVDIVIEIAEKFSDEEIEQVNEQTLLQFIKQL